MYGHLFTLGFFGCKPKTVCLGYSYFSKRKVFWKDIKSVEAQ